MASTDRVRYISVGEVNHTRLQVFSPAGSQVYDSGYRLGNAVVWRLQDQQGTALSDGSYLFLVTVKDFSNNLTQKYGTATLEQGQVYLEQAGRSELAPAQATALEANSLSEVVSAVDRIGAAGLNRTTATESDDGTTASTAATAGTTENPELTAGTGTQNQIAKWIDNSGTLGDSSIFDSGAGVGLGTTDLTDVLLAGNDKFKIVDGPMTFSFRNFSGGQGYFALGSSTNGIKGFVGHTNTADGFTMGSFSNHKLTLRTNSLNRLTIDTSGNVGISTTNPQAKLHVNGEVKFTGFRTETGGSPNVIGGSSGNSVRAGAGGAFIGGGGTINANRVTDSFGTVGGGEGNRAGDDAGTTSDRRYATIGGGFENFASGERSTVGGGSGNNASGTAATIPGGAMNFALGDYGLAAGLRAWAFHKGSFVWSDSTIASGNFFTSTGENQFLINATGGVGIGTNAPGAARLHVAGGNVFIAQPNSLIITSPNGSCWFITVNNAGGLATISVPCP
jgi:hypothetical protein